jgi:uncharacterized protein
LDCDYCYLPNRDNKHQLRLGDLKTIFQRIFESQLLSQQVTIVWHSGEPLVLPTTYYQAAFQVIEELRLQQLGADASITHALQTNGTLLSMEWCRLIQYHRVQIGISLDGPAFLHDAHRKTRTGLGSHASTMRGISHLNAFRVPFHVICVLTNDSLDYPEEIFRFFAENNITRIGFNIDEQEGAHEDSSFARDGIELRYRKFMETFYRLTKEAAQELEIREFEMLKHLICYGSETIPPRNQQVTPFKILTIASNGDFSTFSPELLDMGGGKHADFRFGNLLQSSLESALKDKKFRDVDQSIRLGADLCQSSCEYFTLCGGGAPANKWCENGTFASTETLYCKYTIKLPAQIIMDDLETALKIHGA